MRSLLGKLDYRQVVLDYLPTTSQAKQSVKTRERSRKSKKSEYSHCSAWSIQHI